MIRFLMSVLLLSSLFISSVAQASAERIYFTFNSTNPAAKQKIILNSASHSWKNAWGEALLPNINVGGGGYDINWFTVHNSHENTSGSGQVTYFLSAVTENGLEQLGILYFTVKAGRGGDYVKTQCYTLKGEGLLNCNVLPGEHGYKNVAITYAPPS